MSSLNDRPSVARTKEYTSSIHRSQVIFDDRKRCSNECYKQNRRQQPDNYKTAKREERICKECGAIFIIAVFPSTNGRRFCSAKCSSKSRQKIDYSCSSCGITDPDKFLWSNHWLCRECVNLRHVSHYKDSPHKCKWCHTTDISRFNITQLTTCRNCFYIHAKRHCAHCGTDNPSSFIKSNIWVCRECLYLKAVTNHKCSQCCCKWCHTTKLSDFKIGARTVCKKCSCRHSKKPTPEQKHKYRKKSRSKDRIRSIQNFKERWARDELFRLRARLDADSRVTLGRAQSALTVQEMKTLMHLRLFKLVEGGTITLESAHKYIEESKSELRTTLLALYKYRVKGVMLRGSGCKWCGVTDRSKFYPSRFSVCRKCVALRQKPVTPESHRAANARYRAKQKSIRAEKEGI